ncbi:MAG TPA: hypothetical protein VMY37_10200 [Thermoguttaceae bacterium]|nr:hypothetical protein [Thermoguttaceae bacterium]
MAVVQNDRAHAEIVGALREGARPSYVPGGTKICRLEVMCEGEVFSVVAMGEMADKAAGISAKQRMRCRGRLTAHHWSSGDATAHHHVQLIAEEIEVLNAR